MSNSQKRNPVQLAPSIRKRTATKPAVGKAGGAAKRPPYAAVRVADLEEDIRLLAVRYDGSCFATDPIAVGAMTYTTVWRVHTDDVVLSNINSVNGAVGVVPPEFDGCYVSNEYTVLRAKASINPHVLQLILRTPECRASLLLNASGIGRHRVKLEGAARTRFPYPNRDLEEKVLADLVKARQLAQESKRLLERAGQAVTDALLLDTPQAREILKAFKPPT